MDFAGGFPFTGPWGTVASPNIMPDPSGIPYYDEALFLGVMRTGQVKAILAFLPTTKPVKHRVDNAEPPAECNACKQKHGAGNENK